MDREPTLLGPAIPLIGYTDRLSGRAGDVIEFKVSSLSASPFTAKLVRVVCGDPNPAGPGMIEKLVDAEFEGSYPSREQKFYPGSYVLIEQPIPLKPDSDFTVRVRIFPTLLGNKRQVVLSLGQVWIGLDVDGHLCAGVSGETVSSTECLQKRTWYQVTLASSVTEGKLVLECEEIRQGGRRAAVRNTVEGYFPELKGWSTPAYLTIAAGLEGGIAIDHFNGKIEGPKISQCDECISDWNFCIGMHSTTVTDVSRFGLHGRLVNLPTRAVTSSTWDGTEMNHRHAPEMYAAIHFHDDDIYDFGWETDFSFCIPEDLPSGIYAARIECEGAQDALPFFVCPPKGQRRADLCVLMSTFTYVVYGNHARPDYGPEWHETVAAWGAFPYNPAQYPQYGLSTYNRHSDGSGICHASHRRPLFNLRPGFRTFGYGESSGLRHLPADTHLTAWLERRGIAYDVVTDQELEEEGCSALAGYRGVATGTHPEYHTARTLDALLGYRDAGGRLAYLGGNGFYWRVALHSEAALQGTLEIRRGEGGIRAWAPETGEYYHAFDGAYGGLWRRNARPPQQLVGVGFSAQGQFHGTHYRVKIKRSDPDVGWILDGVDGEEIGGFGFSGGGAAGYELDRVAAGLGTPAQVRVIASSEGLPESFVLVPEEVLTHLTTLSGEEPAAMVRADMVYFDVEGGGAVFSAGSITFCGSLPWNGFENAVSTLLGNVFAHFGVSAANMLKKH